ncbi:hypothetical protein Lal_00010642 [Lupinus albus]|nr:hypothetical protein Lal_00010642 [Lupinus albus]
MGALNAVRKAGKARNIGISNFNVALTDEAVKLSDTPLATNQIEYHPYLDQTKVISAARKHGMSVTAYYLMADGKVPNDPVLQDIGAKHGKTAAQVTLRWAVQQPDIVALSKTATESRLKENFDVFDFALTEEEMQAIHALAKPNGRIGQLRTQRHESGREAAPQPGEDRRARHHLPPDRGGETAIKRKDQKRHGHEDQPEIDHAPCRQSLIRRDELRQEGEKEDRQFWVQQIDEDRLTDDAGGLPGLPGVVDLQRTVFPQRVPRHVEKIGDPQIFDDTEGQRTGVQYGGKAGDGGKQMRHDAKRAAERRDDARPRPLRKTGGQRVDHAGSGRRGDDERCDEEFGCHGAGVSCGWRTGA